MLFQDEDDEEADAGAVTSRQTTIEVKVPHDAVGAITGVQGAQIKMVYIRPLPKEICFMKILLKETSQYSDIFCKMILM